MELFLERHAESLANSDRLVHKEIADHAISLTELGLQQAKDAAIKIQNYFWKNNPMQPGVLQPKVALWISPYLRTRQTALPVKSLVWQDGSPLFLRY